MRRRTGVTLTEVLVAIFIMAIGMVSILALFPVGIQNMSAAATDHRMVFAAHNAEQTAEMVNLKADLGVVGDPASPNAQAGSMYYFLSRNGRTAANNNWGYGSAANSAAVTGPSMPVFVDPIGYQYYSDSPVGNPNRAVYTSLPADRRGMPRARVVNTGGTPELWYSILDDINFNKYGEPAPDFDTPAPATNPIVRERKYSWAYIWRRARFTDPMVVDLTVVVYSGRRARAMTGGASQSPAEELTFCGYSRGASSVFTLGSTTARISWVGRIEDGPPLRRGNWLFDATVTVPAIVPPAPPPPVTGNGYFYRVVDVGTPVQVGGEWQQQFEMQTPARATGHVAVVMAHVVDVFEKSDGLAAGR